MWSQALLLGVLGVCVPARVDAQGGAHSTHEEHSEGGFPDATFDVMFRKYTPPDNVFSPFYSWDAHMAVDATIFRRASNAIGIAATFQTVGTENLGSKVSVGGTGYLLGFGYVHSYSDDFKVSAGLTHLSSHLTRDLDDKLDEQRNNGVPIPIVEDPSEYNVVYFKGQGRLSSYPFTPEFDVIVEPVNFRFNGSDPGYVRPLYLGTRFTLWRGHGKSIVAETQHEIGTNPLNIFSLSYELFARNQPEGRFRIFVSASPGQTMHVSPNIGGVRDGIAFGMRMKFRA